jgi:hypothetical protein
MADELLRLARASNDNRTKLALIEMATELRVMAQRLQPDVRPRGALSPSPAQPDCCLARPLALASSRYEHRSARCLSRPWLDRAATSPA